MPNQPKAYVQKISQTQTGTSVVHGEGRCNHHAVLDDWATFPRPSWKSAERAESAGAAERAESAEHDGCAGVSRVPAAEPHSSKRLRRTPADAATAATALSEEDPRLEAAELPPGKEGEK